MIHLRKSVKIVSTQGRQTLFVVPADFVKRHPADSVAEFFELDTHRLLMFLVPEGQNMNKGYELVHHHGAAQVSIPRHWLQDRAAVKGDEVQIWEDTAQPDRILVRLVPSISDPTTAAAFATPVYQDFRKP